LKQSNQTLPQAYPELDFFFFFFGLSFDFPVSSVQLVINILPLNPGTNGRIRCVPLALFLSLPKSSASCNLRAFASCERFSSSSYELYNATNKLALGTGSEG